MCPTIHQQNSKQPKIAVITGALKGLGLQTAKELSEKGYVTVLSARSGANAPEILGNLKKPGNEVHFELLDIAQTASIESFTNRVLEKFGRVDVLVNNAGIFIDGSEPTLSLAEISEKILETFTTNTLGAYLLSRKLIPLMLKNGFGRIVNVSSGMGQLSEMDGGYPAYRLSKTALNAVTASLASETKGKGILINSVCPGWVKTDMGGENAERSVEKGAETIVWAATLPDNGPTGRFFRDKERLDW